MLGRLRGHITSTENTRKKSKIAHLKPIAFGVLRTSKGSKCKSIKILFDTGATGSFLEEKLAKKLRVKNVAATTFKTGNGPVSTTKKTKTRLIMPELHADRIIEHTFHLINADLGYDMIMGLDLMTELGIDLLCSTQETTWDEATIPWKSSDATVDTSYFLQDSDAVLESMDRIKGILDAKYEKANLEEICEKAKHLSSDEQRALHSVLKKHEALFDGTLGRWTNEEYDIELKPDAKPYHARAYPIPKTYEATLRHEVERLCQIGVLRRVNRSEWGAPTFIIPKKDGTVRFISDFRELNKRIRRKPYPIPKISDLLLKLEGFTYATSLDLNMGYYHIELSPHTRELCTIVLPWGKYEYQRLPMGLCNSPDIFQEKIGTLMADLEFVRAYIDDCLVITKGDWNDHLSKLDTVLQRLGDAGLKVNATKSYFGHSELEYLGYWITRDGIQPLPKKVEAIQKIATPTTKRQLRSFIGLCNFYRDMWQHRADVLAPLTKLTSKTAKWEWGQAQQLAFERAKKIVSREVMLAFPDFNKPFEIHTDASNTQLGAVIAQDGKPIAFYSRKLNDAQTRHTTTERELLAIVETLKEYRNILLGQKIRVYTDHKNLTHTNFNTERVMRWRLILEEYGPELIYKPGDLNEAADALSRLDYDLRPTASSVSGPTYNHLRQTNATLLGFDKDDVLNTSFPLSYRTISVAQTRDKNLQKKALTKAQYSLHTFRGGGKSYDLITHCGKICIPKILQRRTVDWYHSYLCHPGETRTEQTIRLHYYWPNLRDTVHEVCHKCHSCQVTKKRYKKFGHLPPKEAEATPWDTLCLDLIGPYTIHRKNKKKDPLTLWALTMIDPATGWFEMKEITTKQADSIANVIEQTWLTRYPWPSKVIFDRGSEFKAEVTEMLKQDYGINVKVTTTRNPQANSIVERVHQTIGNMMRTFQVYDNDDVEDDDPWSGIFSAIMAAVRCTYSTTAEATPMQLVFGRDFNVNTAFAADWDCIRQRKQHRINENNARENAKRVAHTYNVGDRILVKSKPTTKFGYSEFEPTPYPITAVYDNGTVQIKKRRYYDTINITADKALHCIKTVIAMQSR